MKRSILIGILVLAGLALLLSACGGASAPTAVPATDTPATATDTPPAASTDALQRIKSAGEIVVAVSADYPPFESYDANFKLTGFDIARGARRLVEALQASGHVRRILWVCPPPPLERGVLAEMFQGAEARGATVAGHMRAMAAECGTDFLDAGAVAAVDPLDGVHLNEAAHAALGAAIAAKIAKMLPATT